MAGVSETDGFLSDDEDGLLQGLQKFLAPASPADVVQHIEQVDESKTAGEPKVAAEEDGNAEVSVAESKTVDELKVAAEEDGDAKISVAEAAADEGAETVPVANGGDDANGMHEESGGDASGDGGSDGAGEGEGEINGSGAEGGGAEEAAGMASVVGIVDSDDSDADAHDIGQHGIGSRGRKLRELLAGCVCDDLGLSYDDLVDRVSGAIPRKAIAFQVRGNVLGKNGTRHPATFPSSSSRSAKRRVGSQKECDAALSAIDTTKHVEAAPPAAPVESFVLDDAYSCPTAPIALLRSYAMAGRWVSLCAGHIVFEDDSVLYRADTITPIKCEEHGLVLMSLVSLWLLVALRHRYNESTTLSLCAKHGATRFPAHCAMDVLDFFLGFREHCDQIIPLSELSTVPPPTPTALRRLPTRPLLPLRPDELRSQLFWPVNVVDKKLGSAKPKSAAMPPPDLNAVAPEAAAQAAATLRRLRCEEAALASLVERLTAQLFRTDQELAERAAESQQQRAGYESELAARAKQRRRGRPNGNAFQDPLAPVFGANRCTEVM